MKKLTVIFSLLFGMAFLDMSLVKAQLCPSPSRGRTTTTTTTTTRTTTSRGRQFQERRRTPIRRTTRVIRSVAPRSRTSYIPSYYIKTRNGYQRQSGYSTVVVNNRVWIPENYRRDCGRWVYVPGRWKYIN